MRCRTFRLSDRRRGAVRLYPRPAGLDVCRWVVLGCVGIILLCLHRTDGDDTRALEILTLVFTLAPDYPLFVHSTFEWSRIMQETRHKISSLATHYVGT